MIRNCSLEEISDGRFYDLNDMVKAGCDDCKGCSSCCQGMGTSIVLDPYDCYRLTTGLNQTMEQLLTGNVELNVVDGIILPNLKMATVQGREQCGFLNQEGRCTIHGMRPGICRIFPLGRVYEKDSFQYILQVNECPKPNKTKVKVSKWIDTPQQNENKQFIITWHYFIKEMSRSAKALANEAQVRQLSMVILKMFYLTPYQQDQDFYAQFEQRLAAVKNMLGME